MTVYSQNNTQQQRQQLHAIPLQIQASNILKMSNLELQQFLESEAMENPAMGMKENVKCPLCGFALTGPKCNFCGAVKKNHNIDKIKQSDNPYVSRLTPLKHSDPGFDPFRTVASFTDLKENLKQQARMSVDDTDKMSIAEYLIDSLDEQGYLRESLYEIAEEFKASVPQIEEVLKIIQSFEPAGIGARDLRECLLIQISSILIDCPEKQLAKEIITNYWEDFSKLKLKSIAKKMKIDITDIKEASEYIRTNCNPKPASAYRAPFEALAPSSEPGIVPDVVVLRKGESVTAHVVDFHSKVVKIDDSYNEAYQNAESKSKFINENHYLHIKEHVERVKAILDAVDLRKQTLARIADYLVQYQKDFVINGPLHLKPLKQKDVAKALELHESTICRAISKKFMKLPNGEVVPIDMFFDAALPVRTMIEDIIKSSDKQLSDSEIAKELEAKGVKIARRTVAKYRDQIRILPHQLRAA
ncbi:MAG: RNA polymerase factor sigma-54 [Armatimonadota bacterium]